MVIALGLYLLLRGFEATAIRIGDVNRAQGKIRVHVFKSKKTVWMPICAELDQESQRWLTWYAEWAQHALGRGLDDQWYLVPAKDPFRYELDPVTKKFVRQAKAAGLRPAQRIQRVFDVTKTVLVAAGYPVTDPDGQPTWDGVHTLRRSGARALWESLLNQGFDRATFRVQAMLHHKDPKTTLHYIGYDEEEAELMRTLRGQVMYPEAQPAANVVDLAGRRNER